MSCPVTISKNKHSEPWPRPRQAGRLLLVIPCFRESARIAVFLGELLKVLETCSVPTEVLVVDDGSGAKEAEDLADLIEKLAHRHRHLLPLLALPENVGKGGAIYAAWKQAGAREWLAFADADGATSASEIRRVIELLPEKAADIDALLGSRVLMLGKTVERSTLRHYTGRIYATLSSFMTGIPVYDSQCGFKIIRHSAYQRVSAFLTEFRFGFDMELISFLTASGAVLEEVPVNWKDAPGSKVRLFRDSTTMFLGLLRLRGKLRQLQSCKKP